ncbi:GntR family transcriptional regulator [Streptacidiphilus jiangxiensis]|uniref:GntR family transcriptional regulator n=1 Tax=Streptacidiphilus jiangxiensis TaxID=235985 RepID=A0A1H8BT71_STRJI|nr:GntR family transcriptional regulator [Streptacidiphilus jiangxiensis]SEM86065.1 GntR family transcriptional regulator [Streptacidiphilus jiangxiensis]
MTHPGRPDPHPWCGKMATMPTMPTPQFQQLANDLRDDIDAGKIEAWAWLPSVRALSNSLGAAKNTVSAALRVLVDEGRLEVKPNKGYRVLPRPSPIRLLLDGHGRLRPVEEGVLEAPRTQVEQASAEVAKALSGSALGEQLLVRHTELIAGSSPFGIAATHFPRLVADRAPALTDPGVKDVQALLDGLGMVETSHTLEMTARSATPDQSRALRVAAGAPLLVLRRLALGADGPLYLTITSLRPDRVELHTDHPKR